MRIISGKYAKRNLFTLKSQKTRPTSDKVKESLFNSLGQFFLLEERSWTCTRAAGLWGLRQFPEAASMRC